MPCLADVSQVCVYCHDMKLTEDERDWADVLHDIPRFIPADDVPARPAQQPAWPAEITEMARIARLPVEAFAAHRARQRWLAERYIETHADSEDTHLRAAQILTAWPDAGPARQVYGITAAEGRDGEQARCRACHQRWTVSPELGVYDMQDGAGLCFGCVISRPVVPVVTGEVVDKKPRSRAAKKAVAS